MSNSTLLNQNCKICAGEIRVHAQAKIMPQQYTAVYCMCQKCEYVFIDNPHWLELAYQESITDNDIGLVNRNQRLSVITFAIIRSFFASSKQFLDFAGGYGLFVRMMRNLGCDFFWEDRHTKNIFAKSFEAQKASHSNFEMVTAFEVLEHLENPITELESLFKRSQNILFSTELFPAHKPQPHEWPYYALEHGQHIGFFSKKTLLYIANKYQYHLYSNGNDIHLFTKNKLSNIAFTFVTKYKFAFMIRYLFKKPSLQEKDQKTINMVK